MTAAVLAPERAERSRRATSWALAARLARREVRRRKGRTALVMALIAIPVLAMTVASVVYRTTADSWVEEYRRWNGASDMAVTYVSIGSARRPGDFDPSALPAGSRFVSWHDVGGSVVPASGYPSVWVAFSDLPLADPITDGMVEVIRGRVPGAANEVLLHPDVADELGVDVGERLDLVVPDVSYEVVGVGRSAAVRDERLMVVGDFDFDSLPTVGPIVRGLVDLPPGVTASSIDLGLSADAIPVVAPETTWYGSRARSVTDVAWGWVAGVLALTVTGIIIAAAFATSARRQLVTLGQLAANGADRRALRRMLALQGLWSGALGALVGVVAGLALVLPQHGLLERIVNHSLGPMTVAPMDLVIIVATGMAAATIAAFVPSRTVSQVPVLSALAGRRPLGRVPRWLVPTGVALFIGGLALIALAASVDVGDASGNDGQLYAAVAVVGGLGVLFGMCCMTPAIVSVLGRVGERSRGTTRLAARSTARVRTRSAAIVAAVAAAGALSIGGGTAVATSWNRDDSVWSRIPYLAENMVSVVAYDWDAGNAAVISDGEGAVTVQTVDISVPPAASVPELSGSGATPTSSIAPTSSVAPTTAPASTSAGSVAPAVPDSALAAIRAIVPDAREIPIQTAALRPVRPVTGVEPGMWTASELLVVDGPLADVIGLSSDDRSALASGAVLAGWEGSSSWPTGSATVETSSGSVTFDVQELSGRPAVWAYSQMPMISPDRAAQLGLSTASAEVLFVATQPFASDQRLALQSTADTYGGLGASAVFLPDEEVQRSGFAVNVGNRVSRYMPKAFVDGLIVGGALLFVLAVVAVGLALSAAESRDERDVLLAVGAPPRAMRRVSAQKAVLLAALGGVLAVPTGFLPVAVVIAQISDDSVRFPWLVALGCVAIVPFLVGAATFVGSAAAQRVRPVRMSTLATD